MTRLNHQKRFHSESKRISNGNKGSSPLNLDLYLCPPKFIFSYNLKILTPQYSLILPKRFQLVKILHLELSSA